MNAITTLAAGGLLALALGAGTLAAPTQDTPPPTPETPAPKDTPAMQLGNFSVSLAVKELEASRAFYEKLGFKVTGGDASQNWLVLRNGTTTIGLFQGMFEKNILTFNPGWNQQAEPLDSFTDVRELERMLREQDLEPVQSAKPGDGRFIEWQNREQPKNLDRILQRPVGPGEPGIVFGFADLRVPAAQHLFDSDDRHGEMVIFGRRDP